MMSRASFAAAAALAVVIAAGMPTTSAEACGNHSYPLPSEWPVVHTHSEIMYTVDLAMYQYKPVRSATDQH
jgi:hypothetical protein